MAIARAATRFLFERQQLADGLDVADPVLVDASGTSLGAVSVLASQASGYITIVLPTAALGTVGPGWRLTVVLHGQDGFAPGRARGFAPTPQEVASGVCQPGGTSPSARSIPPRCQGDGRDHPNRVSQATELNLLAPPVEITAVPVP